MAPTPKGIAGGTPERTSLGHAPYKFVMATGLLASLLAFCKAEQANPKATPAPTAVAVETTTGRGNAQAPSAVTLRVVASLDEVRQKGVPRVVDFTVLHLNDVYDVSPVEGGRRGGLARVATLRRKLAQETSNILTVLSGDFLSPSVIAAITGDAGKHMVESLNAVGLSYATMGNHEFDITQPELLSRIEESHFQWVVSNVKDEKGKPFPKVAENAVVTFSGQGGEQVRVGLVGVCIDMVKRPWVTYQNPIESARVQVDALAGKADVFVALTHLTMAQDKQLGIEVPRLDVLLGGHEHEAAKAIVGDDQTPIFKADSNARTAYVHRFRFDAQTRTTTLFSQLIPIDTTIEEEPETAALIAKWSTLTFDKMRAQGYDPAKVVGRTSEPLLGEEADVRSKSTNLTQLIMDAFIAEVPEADAAILPAGLIRIDGIIPPGDITYFDLVRIFPIGGKLSLLAMPAAMLRTLLQVGDAGKGTGAFQHRVNVTGNESSGWVIKGAPLSDNRVYKVLFSETPTTALSEPPYKGTGTKKIRDTRDMRAILADRLRRDLRDAGH